MTTRRDNRHYKVCLLGEGRVGKTSLLRRFVSDEFSEKEQSTVQASMFSRKQLQVGDDVVTVAIWDTAGQERFHALGPIYYRDADGALLVYDITDVETFERVRHWIRELRSIVGDGIALCVVGNKVDLERSRQVPLQDAEAFCRSVGADHFSTSAKLNKNVSECFALLARKMVQTRAKVLARNASSGVSPTTAHHTRGGSRNTLRILDDDEEGGEDGVEAARANSTTTKKCCG